MHTLIALVCLTSFTLAADSGNATRYGDRIVAPEKLSADATAAVGDLLQFLKRITNHEFTRSTDRGDSGITLAHTSDNGVPAGAIDKLKGLGPEAFCLWPEGARLWIVAHADAGLAHGAVEYLEQLGVRWFHVTEHWTIVPRRDDVRLAQPIVKSPAFRYRAFAGSGGFGPATPRDPQRQMQVKWGAWQRRNRFGGEFQLSGHSGEAFNTKYRKELEEHPEYRALVKGERAAWWLAGKFCVSNPTVLQMYVDDRLATYRQARKLDPTSPRSWAVSVEPADGGGHCECAECAKLGSVSDRVFHVANLVARKVRQEFPDGHVSLFAYHEHAMVPSIAIEPNVYVAVIPYAFQRTELAPEQLIDAWGKKVPQMAIYDYWSIPDWSHDAPSFDPLVAGPAKLRSWHRRGVNGFLNESTFSGGAMGFAWWSSVKLAWEPDRDVEQLLKQYCHEAFGAGAAPIERMLRRWSVGYWPTTHELALSFRDVDEAWRLVEHDPACAARVADYARYVEYLRLLYAYDTSKHRSEEKYQAGVALADYGWSIYDSAMVHAYRHAQLLARDESPTHAEILKRYDYKDPAAPGWAASTPLTDEQVRARLTAGLQQLTPQDFVVRRYSGQLRPLIPSVPKPATQFGPEFWPSSTQTIHLHIPTGMKTVTLKLAIEQPVRLTLLDANGGVVQNQTLTGTAEGLKHWQEVTINTAEPGAYQLLLWSPKRTFGLQMPLNVPHSLPGWTNSQGRPTPRLYFYVLKDVARVAIYARYVAAGPPKFFGPDGKEVMPTFVDGQRLILIDIPESQRGQVWSLDKAKSPIEFLQMLNVPGSFAFSAETLLVPEDAIGK